MPTTTRPLPYVTVPRTSIAIKHSHLIQGPVMAEGLGEPASKEELKARAAELNK